MAANSPDLVSLVLFLRPETACTASADLGRAAQAAFLQAIGADCPALAARLHAGNGLKPYTASSLQGVGPRSYGQVALTPEQEYWLRFSSCDRELSAWLLAWAEQPPKALRLGHAVLHVLRATAGPDGHPWAAGDRWEDLVARHLRGPAPALRQRLQFLSPTAFDSTRGHDELYPEPGLLFGSLAGKWNAFSPYPLAGDVRTLAQEVWMVSRYSLSTRVVRYDDRRGVGFVGECEYQARTRDREALRLFSLLAAFALYGGVGHWTTAGMGQARAVENG